MDDLTAPNPNGDQLQSAFDLLVQISDELNGFLKTEESVEIAQRISRVQNDLRSAAGKIVNVQIDRLTREADITAEKINAAVKAANDVVEKIAQVKKRLTVIGHLLDFVGAVVSGDAKGIIKAAGVLKNKLDAT